MFNLVLEGFVMQNASLQQNQSLQQTLSPQMRQSLKMLQAPTTELQQLLSQAIEINPVLELDASLESLDADNNSIDERIDEDWDDDWREQAITERRNVGDVAEAQAKRDFFFDSIVAPTTLAEHLLRQLSSSDATKEVKDAAECLIGNLNSRGFLDAPLTDIAIESHVNIDHLERAKHLLHRFDPPGIAAIDVRESLLIQLETIGMASSVEYEIIDGYLSELASNQYTTIGKALGLDEEEVAKAAQRIAELDPSPGSAFDGTQNPHIQADLIASRDENGEWTISANDGFLPKLSINREYKDLLASHGIGKEARNFLRENLRDARTMIRSLEQRQHTLLMIGHEIAKRQQKVLSQGLTALQPMTMNDVAQVLDLHATTISRAVGGKYLRCPAGLLELRSFFTSGYERADGSTISNTKVKARIKDLVDAEDPKKPLSDNAIVKILAKEDMKLARRTVAKYREQLNIAPTHQRRLR